MAPAGTEKSQPPVEIKPDSRPLDEKGSNDEIKGPVSNAIEIKGKDHETITLQVITVIFDILHNFISGNKSMEVMLICQTCLIVLYAY